MRDQSPYVPVDDELNDSELASVNIDLSDIKLAGDQIGKSITRDETQGSSFKLPIGSYFIFKPTDSHQLQVVQNTRSVNKAIEGQWYVSNNSDILRTVLQRNHPLFAKIMQDPQPYRHVFKEVGGFTGIVVLIRIIAAIDLFFASKYLANYDSIEPGTLAASNLIFTTQNFLTFIVTALFIPQQIFITQAKAKGNTQDIINIYQSAYLLGGMLSILPMLGMIWMEPLTTLLGQEKVSAKIAQDFFRAFVIGFPAQIWFSADRFFSYGHFKTMPIFIVSALGLGLSLGLGKYLTSEYGPKGEGYALAIEAWFNFLLYKGYLIFSKEMSSSSLFHRTQQKYWPTIKKLFWEGLPIATQIAIELGGVLAITYLVGGYLTSESSSALQIISNYNFIEITFNFSIAQAAQVLISRMHSFNLPNTMKRYAHASTILTLSVSTIFLSLYSALHRPLTNYFLEEVDPEKASTIHDLVSVSLPIMAAGQMCDGPRNVQMSALRSAFDTWPITAISLVSLIGIFIPSAIGLGKEYGLAGMTGSFAVCIAIALFLVSLRYGKFIHNPQKFKQDKQATQEWLGQKTQAAKIWLTNTFSCFSANPREEQRQLMTDEAINAESVAGDDSAADPSVSA